MADTLIRNATLVNEGDVFVGDLLIHDGRIAEIIPADEAAEKKFSIPNWLHEVADHSSQFSTPQEVDATGCYLLPGIIDTHVHFRDGGMSENPAGDFASESRAARAGGVTSVIDMPNTKPQTTTLEALEGKEVLAARTVL